MTSRVAYYFAALAIILMYNMIFPVKGQSTALVSEDGDLSNGIDTQQTVDAINRLNIQIQSIFENFSESFQHLKNQQEVVLRNLQAVDQSSEGQNICISQVQGIYEYFNSSFLQMQYQQDTTMTFLQAVDRHSQEQVQNIHDILNWTIQQMEYQQDAFFKSLQAVDRRSQEQCLYIKQVNSIHELFNASFQEMKIQQDHAIASIQAVDRRTQKQEQDMQNLSLSLQQMKNQQDTVVTSLQAADRRSQKQELDMQNLNISLQQIKSHLNISGIILEDSDRRLCEKDISFRNQTQNLWKLATAYGSDLGEVPILQSTVNDWIVLMSRFDGSLNFNRSWAEYKNGFGDILRGEFWLGNEKIYRLTSRFSYRLHIELQLKSNGQWYYADYDTFSIDSEGSNYTLRLSGFSGGTAGDSLTNTSLESDGYHGGMSFSTFDADNDKSTINCAQHRNGGWWFNACHFACFTGAYNSTSFRWYSLRHLSPNGELQAARMMIKIK